jgi:hypothetical protein
LVGGESGLVLRIGALDRVSLQSIVRVDAPRIEAGCVIVPVDDKANDVPISLSVNRAGNYLHLPVFMLTILGDTSDMCFRLLDPRGNAGPV